MSDITTNMDWPPNYTIRNSKRAKRLILQISPRLGLVVIVPDHRRHPKIEALLQEKRHWIQKNLAYFQAKRKPHPDIFLPPTELHLPAILKTLKLDYQKTSHKSFKILALHSKIQDKINENGIDENGSECSYLILGPIEDSLLLIKTLKRLLKQIAGEHLIPWLKALSLDIQFPYQTVSIRSQSSLWGSCTALKKISLNMKLLFLPRELTRYVLLHELCHTVYLNHSKQYWNLLKRFDPQCLKHRRLLRRAGQYLPTWIEEPE